MRDITLLGARLVLGGYLTVHGAQKLFGAFGGHGLEKTGAGFEKMGLTPGKEMATLAGATEFGGGLLTATGIAHPLGPLAIMGAMTVASATHRENGPLAANRGFELPLTNLAAAAALAVSGPGRIRLSPPLPRYLTALAVLGGSAVAGVSLAKLLSAVKAEDAQQSQAGETAQAGAAQETPQQREEPQQPGEPQPEKPQQPGEPQQSGKPQQPGEPQQSQTAEG
jgi:putative oxidoreductase